MRFLLLLLMLSFFKPSASAQVVHFYLGTENYRSPSPGIYLGTLDPQTGKLGPVTLVAQTPNPDFLAIKGNFLYSTKNPLRSENKVVAFAMRPDDSLEQINEQPSAGSSVCHLSLSHDGAHVLAANYSGEIICLPITANGSLGEKTAWQKFVGTGPNLKRQDGAHPHFITTDPEDGHVYTCDLGSDKIWINQFDAKTGTLTPNDPPFATLAPGSGPRHLAFHPSGKFVYVINELGITTTAFTRDAKTGALTEFQTLSNLPEGASPKGMTSAAIFCHPTGKWLYTSDRGPDDSLTVFSIADDGKLALIQHISAAVKMPRAFALDSTGHWLLAAGQMDGKLALFKIDQTTGQLTLADQASGARDATCVLFAP